MTGTIKECIKALSAEKALKGYCYGKLVSNILFTKFNNAIVLDGKESCYYVLSRGENLANERLKITSQLAELLNVVDYLLDNQLIYVVGGANKGLMIFYDNVETIESTQIEGEYRCSNGDILKYDKGAYFLHVQNGQVLESLDSDTGLYDRLSKILTSCIYPTAQLKEYIDRDFCTEDHYIANESLKSSKWSIRCAIVIAVLSPIAALLIGNKWGVTKIDCEQFQTLKEITTVHDTLKYVEHDTINTVIHDTITTIPLKSNLKK